MTRLWADGFDVYASGSDVALRYTTFAGITLNGASSTAFNLGGCASGLSITKRFETSTNETTIFGSVRLKYNSSVTNGGNTFGLTFYDGVNAQASINWYGDGSIVVRSGSGVGTTLATYTEAFTLNVWDSWQFSFVINNTTGAVSLRKNGASSDTYTLTGVNTRAGSGNNYVNIVAFGSNTVFLTDDFWLNNNDGTAPTGWPPDVRAVQQTVSGGTGTTAFAPAQSTYQYGSTSAVLASQTLVANSIYFEKFISTVGGTTDNATITLSASLTGDINAAIYDDTGPGGSPGTRLAQATALVNPSVGTVTFTMTAPATLVRGSAYYIAFFADAAFSVSTTTTGVHSNMWGYGQSYGSGFPSTITTAGVNASLLLKAYTLVTPSNWSLVSDAAEDGDSTYVYSSTINAEDLYTLSALPVTPNSILGVEVFMVARKSDSGARTVSLRYKANGSADTDEGTTALSNNYTFTTKFLPLDPTGASWTQAHVEGANIGVKVIS